LTTFFVDTSALAKRYVREVGTAWVRSWIVPSAGNVIVISDLTTVEMIALLARQVRDGKLSVANETILSSVFLVHVEKRYISVQLDAAVLAPARTMARKHALRTLDAIQLSCALRAVALLNEPMTFISGDNKLLAAASAEGFAIDNPYLHP